MAIIPRSGTGPGSITPDGSPVEFYTLLKPRGEAELVAGVVPRGGSVLELGAGVGRVTHALLEHGFEVVAVDESAEMLAHVRGARTVQARAQDLRLERRFDAVTLGSFLVNTADEDDRRELLSACARHVAPGGAVLIEWTPPETHDARRPGRVRTDGDITVTLAALEKAGPGLFNATMRYTHGDRVWTQSFTSRRLTDDDLRAALAECGLRLDRFLTEDRAWALAVPGLP
ncbi:class I SAM-dependent methyltransferase [Nonomuraea sp. NPDC049158]|uniref:class I SAM-dependent methyltransferase n=1 Tax=Nonomuraea sp. NPDC049158 TaxID=3155649 RepID=UPI0033F0C862